MSISTSLHRAHKARLERIASRAALLAGPTDTPSERPRYVMDRDYERAWSAAILGWAGGGQRGKRRIEEIQRVTAQHFGLEREDLLADSRAIALARPRHVAMFLARKLTTKGFAEIGECFAGRDHTSVLHAVRRVRHLLTRDAELSQSVEFIRTALGEV